MGARAVTKFTGTITGQVDSFRSAFTTIAAALGWTTLYSATNKIVLQNASGFVVRIVDDGSLAAGAREAIFRGAEGATGVDTLTNPFPLVAFRSDAACVIRKSDTADSTTRNYIAVGDEDYIVFAVKFGTTTSDVYRFGVIDTPRSADVYACILNCRGQGNVTTAGTAMGVNASGSQLASGVGGNTGAAFARSLSGLILAPTGGYVRTVGNAGIGTANDAGASYPGDAVEFDLQPIRAFDTGNPTGVTTNANGRMRGHLPFEFEPLHGNSMTGIANYDTFSDTDYDPAAEFTLVSASDTVSNNVSRTVLQTAGTWDGGL